MKIKVDIFQVYLAVLLLDKIRCNKLEKKRVFCGSSLAEILTQFCLVYHSPTDHRVKRQIVTECCYNKCSLNYLIANYCKTSNSKALEKYLNDPEVQNDDNNQTDEVTEADVTEYNSDAQGGSTLSRRYRQRNSTGSKQNFHQENSSTGYHSFHDNNTGPRRKLRGKRNCTCKKRTNNKKSKRANKLLQNEEVLFSKTKTVPEPKVGKIEESQKPFYILNRYKRLF